MIRKSLSLWSLMVLFSSNITFITFPMETDENAACMQPISSLVAPQTEQSLEAQLERIGQLANQLANIQQTQPQIQSQASFSSLSEESRPSQIPSLYSHLGLIPEHEEILHRTFMEVFDDLVTDEFRHDLQTFDSRERVPRLTRILEGNLLYRLYAQRNIPVATLVEQNTIPIHYLIGRAEECIRTRQLQQNSVSQQGDEENVPSIDAQLAQSIVNSGNRDVELIIYSIAERECRAREQNPITIEGITRVLFTGPPGTGKTTLAEAIALVLQRRTKFICPVRAMNRFQFCLQEYLESQLNALIECDQPCVIVIDEIDQLNVGQNGNEGTVNPVYALNNCMERCRVKDSGRDVPHFIFLATTNNLDQIPDVLLSRFKIVRVNNPDDQLRKRIITDDLSNSGGIDIAADCNNERRISSFVGKTKNLSIRDIQTIVNQAKTIAMAEANELRRRNGGHSEATILKRSHLDAAYNDVWRDTIAARNRWFRQLGRHVAEVAPDYGERLFIGALEAMLHGGINFAFGIPERRRNVQWRQDDIDRIERHRSEDIAREAERHAEGIAREDERFAEPNRWGPTIRRWGGNFLGLVGNVGGGVVSGVATGAILCSLGMAATGPGGGAAGIGTLALKTLIDRYRRGPLAMGPS